MDLELIADAVLKKLKARYPNKFSVEDSINRDYTKESQASGLLGNKYWTTTGIKPRSSLLFFCLFIGQFYENLYLHP